MPCVPGGFVGGRGGAYAPNAAKGVDMAAAHGEGTRP